MEEKTIIYIGISILALMCVALFSIMDNLIYLRKNIENKINGNCIYVNNEFYCKD